MNSQGISLQGCRFTHTVRVRARVCVRLSRNRWRSLHNTLPALAVTSFAAYTNLHYIFRYNSLQLLKRKFVTVIKNSSRHRMREQIIYDFLHATRTQRSCTVYHVLTSLIINVSRFIIICEI